MWELTNHNHRADNPEFMKRLLVVPLVLLLCSCSTMTPDRIALLSALAGSAAQIGLQIYLSNNPTHRPGAQAVVDALRRIEVPTEQAVATELQSLPTTTLKGPESELYVADTGKLVIWDKQRKKAFDVPPGLAGEAVARAVRDGLRRAMVVRPPMPTPRRFLSMGWTNDPAFAVVSPPPLPPAKSPYTLEAMHGVPTNNAYPPGWFAPTGILTAVVESPTPAVPAGKHSPRSRVGIYTVERRDNTNWVEVNSFTSGPAAEFRVRRVK